MGYNYEPKHEKAQRALEKYESSLLCLTTTIILTSWENQRGGERDARYEFWRVKIKMILHKQGHNFFWFWECLICCRDAACNGLGKRWQSELWLEENYKDG